MSCQWFCPACNEYAFWSYASPHACDRSKEDEGNTLRHTTDDTKREKPSMATEERE